MHPDIVSTCYYTGSPIHKMHSTPYSGVSDGVRTRVYCFTGSHQSLSITPTICYCLHQLRISNPSYQPAVVANINTGKWFGKPGGYPRSRLLISGEHPYVSIACVNVPARLCSPQAFPNLTLLRVLSTVFEPVLHP